MPVDVVLGLSYGDEGKGKIVDYFAKCYDYVVRFHGGNNAGHTLTINGNRTSVHALPSGILHPHVNNVIGNGCVVNPVQLVTELEKHGGSRSFVGRLFISDAAHLITPDNIELDKSTGSTIGTTGKGIGPTYSGKMKRSNFRMADLAEGKLNDIFGKTLCEIISPFVCNTQRLLTTAVKSGAQILLEGAQGTMLDIDHGTYPYVTSSNCTIGAALTGTGLNHKAIRKVYGVTKSYSTRVGNGPFPTEQKNDLGRKLREIGGEYGTTTGRERRCGWLNLGELRYACSLNGVDELIVTKLDVLDTFEKIPVFMGANEYFNFEGWNSTTKGLRDKNKLPENLLKYINAIKLNTQIPVTYISTSPEREDIIAL